MAHIIPRVIGYNIGYADTDTDQNCILLSNGLHSLFDNFQWTLDIFSFLDLPVESDEYFRSTMLIYKMSDRSSLSGCENKIFSIPIRYFTSFYAHYYVYLHWNYTYGQDQTQLFQACLESELYKELRSLQTTTQIKQFLLGQRKKDRHDCTFITNHRWSCDGRNFRILWHLWSWGHSTWEPRDNLSDGLYTPYEDLVERRNDPDWPADRHT